MTLTVDEKRRVRFDTHGWAKEKSVYVPTVAVELFDGPIHRNYYSRGENFNYPSASISKHDPPRVGRQFRFLAIEMVYRPFDPRMNCFDPEKLRLNAEQATIDGHPCVIVEQGDRDYYYKVWADTSRDYVPVRYVDFSHGRVSIQTNISYSKDAEYGWVPTAWTSEYFVGAETRDIEIGLQTTTVMYKLNETIPGSAVSTELSVWYVGPRLHYQRDVYSARRRQETADLAG